MAEAPRIQTYNALVECVDRLNALLEEQRERIAEQSKEISHLRGVIQIMISSAHPHPVEHPTMTWAWEIARQAIKDAE